MALVKDLEQTYQRFGVYIDQLQQIMKKYDVRGTGWSTYRKLVSTLGNRQARGEISEVLKLAAAHDGGKLGIGGIGLVLSLSIGGVGIAAMGGAFGISAAMVSAITAICGAILGNELDSSSWTKRIFSSVGLGYDPALLESSTRALEGANAKDVGRLESSEGEILSPKLEFQLQEFDAIFAAVERIETDMKSIKEYQKLRSEHMERLHDKLEGRYTGFEREFREKFASFQEQNAAMRSDIGGFRASASANFSEIRGKISTSHQLLSSFREETFSSMSALKWKSVATFLLVVCAFVLGAIISLNVVSHHGIG